MMKPEEALKALGQAQIEILKKISELRIDLAAEQQAVHVVLGALIASHPDPVELRHRFAEFSSASLTMLAATETNSAPEIQQQAKDRVARRVNEVMNTMLSLLPPTH